MTDMSELYAKLAKEQAAKDAENRKNGIPRKPFATVEPGEADRIRAQHAANKVKLAKVISLKANTTKEAG